MSCTYAFIGLPKGKDFTRPVRIMAEEDAVFINMAQIEIEKKLGCFFYNFNPEFFVDNTVTQERFYKVGLAACPGYNFAIIKAKIDDIENPEENTYNVQITLYRGCCIVRNISYEHVPEEIPPTTIVG